MGLNFNVQGWLKAGERGCGSSGRRRQYGMVVGMKMMSSCHLLLECPGMRFNLGFN